MLIKNNSNNFEEFNKSKAMAYLEFNKEKLVNLEYSLEREILLTNRAGGYVNTTIVGCNTRKYHGLLVVPIKDFGDQKHILLSDLHESLVQHGKSFNLGITSYGEVYEPRGHKYIVDFEMDYASTITYQVGGMKLTKTIMFVRDSEEVLIKYTLVEAHSPTIIKIKPFLAFRNIHSLTHENADANTRYNVIDNGVAFNLYSGFPTLNLQINKKNEWVAAQNWYKGVTYKEESRRGFANEEDLFSPGYFELPIKKGESIILSASTSEVKSKALTTRFNNEVAKRDNSRSSYLSCLSLAANQFVTKMNKEYSICSGYSWDYETLRDGLLALPGLTLYNGESAKTFETILDSLIKRYKKDLVGASNLPDAALKLIITLEIYLDWGGDEKVIWRKYGQLIREILKSFTSGVRPEISLHDNGLLWAKKEGVALSWMETYVEGRPVNERHGYQVELNALWYNGLLFAADLERKFGRQANAQEYAKMAAKLRENFSKIFVVEDLGYLADCVNENGQDRSVRPNQLIACALKYSPADDITKMQVLRTVTKELLTTRGIRTLSPKNPLYKGVYEGDQEARDRAHFNGCALPGLLGFYITLDLALNGKRAIKRGQELVNACEEDMTIHGVGSVAEMYDGDPYHKPHGCISSAISVAALLRSNYLLNNKL